MTSRAASPGNGRLRFIEVKGRVSGAPTITVTRNEILYSLNSDPSVTDAPIFKPGDVVEVPFPYTDRPTRQRRPALIVSSPGL